MAYEDVELEHRSKQPAHICRMDAKARDAKNMGLYSPAQIAQGQRLFADVSSAYFRSRVFLNYRENFIAVKVEAPAFADRVSLEVGVLNTACAAVGVDTYTNRSAIIYRIWRV